MSLNSLFLRHSFFLLFLLPSSSPSHDLPGSHPPSHPSTTLHPGGNSILFTHILTTKETTNNDCPGAQPPSALMRPSSPTVLAQAKNALMHSSRPSTPCAASLLNSTKAIGTRPHLAASTLIHRNAWSPSLASRALVSNLSRQYTTTSLTVNNEKTNVNQGTLHTCIVHILLSFSSGHLIMK